MKLLIDCTEEETETDLSTVISTTTNTTGTVETPTELSPEVDSELPNGTVIGLPTRKGPETSYLAPILVLTVLVAIIIILIIVVLYIAYKKRQKHKSVLKNVDPKSSLSKDSLFSGIFIHFV